LYHLPLGGRPIDPVGLACYLVNGVFLNTLTLFKGVTALDLASVYTLVERDLVQHSYWRFGFGSARPDADIAALKADLSDLLVTSVQRRVFPDESRFFSLSAGGDSTGILGILGRSLQTPDVHCFSYVYGPPQPQHDASIAAYTSSRVGYAHEILQSYNGDLISVLQENVERGMGYAKLCDEIDVWRSLEPRFASARSALYVGDQGFGTKDAPITTPSEALRMVEIFEFDQVAWLRRLLAPSVYAELRDAWEYGFAAMLQRFPGPGDDVLDMADFFFIDQRVQYNQMPWREKIIGSSVEVRNPFLDSDVLDFMSRVPTAWRRGKRLYKETVMAMFPDLFEFGRATAGYVPDWQSELLATRARLNDLDIHRSGPLDAYLPVDMIEKLLQINASERRMVQRGMDRINRLSQKVLRRIKRVPAGLPAGLSRREVPRAVLTMRVILLRWFVQRLDARNV
jgi:hypothetical protein